MPQYLVVTKWAERSVPRLGTVKEPSCNIAGITSCEHVTGKVAVKDDHILCIVECTPELAASIESQNLGVVLWERDIEPTTEQVSAANEKLATYGIKNPVTKDAETELAQEITEATVKAEAKGFFASIFGGK